MRIRQILLLGGLCAVLAGVAQVRAQTDPMQQSQSMTEPSSTLPKLLWIYHEDVKAAKGGQHERIEQGFANFWTNAHVQPFLAMDALSGKAPVTIFISAYDSYGAFENDYQTFNKASNGAHKAEFEALERQEADVVSSLRSVVASFRPDISYLTGEFKSGLPRSRYMQIETMHVRPGKDASFAEGAKMFVEAYRKANIERPFAIYETVSGGPMGTFLIFSPLTSLKELDDEKMLDQRVAEAMGMDKWKEMMNGAGEVFQSIERDIYTFNPKISHVSADFAAVDPQFWGTPSQMMARSSTSREGAVASKRIRK